MPSNARFVESADLAAAHKANIQALAFTLDGRLLASVADDKIIKVWETSTGKCLGSKENPKKLTAVAFSNDGRNVIYSDRFGDVHCFSTPDLSTKVSLKLGHYSLITDLKLTPQARSTQ